MPSPPSHYYHEFVMASPPSPYYREIFVMPSPPSPPSSYYCEICYAQSSQSSQSLLLWNLLCPVLPVLTTVKFVMPSPPSPYHCEICYGQSSQKFTCSELYLFLGTVKNRCLLPMQREAYSCSSVSSVSYSPLTVSEGLASFSWPSFPGSCSFTMNFVMPSPPGPFFLMPSPPCPYYFVMASPPGPYCHLKFVMTSKKPLIREINICHSVRNWKED